MLQVTSKATMKLTEAKVGQTLIITDLDTQEEEMNDFLLRLGFYPGERITLINKNKHMCTVVIKNSRYSIDSELARSIVV